MEQTQEQTTLVTDFTKYDVSDLAWLIIRDWKKTSKKGIKGIYFGAVPYLNAMRSMDSFDQAYGCDTGKTIGIYFLSNATTYRGDQAKLVKAEIKRRLGIK